MASRSFEPIVISGPSGAGKSLFVDYLVDKEYPFYQEAIGYTTRAKRDGEDKINCISVPEFESLIASDSLIEYCNYNGNYYGMSKEEFERLKNCNLIFNVGYSSASVIKGLYPSSPSIYMLPPTKEELLSRLQGRDYNRYLIGMEETLAHAAFYEYLMISYPNDLARMHDDFLEIMESRTSASPRLILSRNQDFLRRFYRWGTYVKRIRL